LPQHAACMVIDELRQQRQKDEREFRVQKTRCRAYRE
jgi:hypothetical protein